MSASILSPRMPRGPDEAVEISVVIPAYNEAESVGELYEELVGVLASLESPCEIAFVDDGSNDATAEKLAALAGRDSRVRILSLARNLGKSAAYDAGFEAARGSVIVTLDADLQDDPHEIPKLLARLREGFDLVVGWKHHRFENEPRKTLASRMFNALVRWIFDLPLRDSNSGFRVMRAEVAHSLELRGDLYRFIPQLAALQGFRVTEEAVSHRRRRHGKSKYGASRFWTGLLDLLTVRFLTRFSQRPLHFLGTLGLVPFVLGCLLEAYVLTMKLLGGAFQTHIAAIVVGVMLITVGFQCIVTGLLGELLCAEKRRWEHPMSRRSRDRVRPW